MKTLSCDEQDVILKSDCRTREEMISYIAHQWRQPLNALAITIQNLQESWEFGEVDETVIKQTTEQSMELILSMSQCIDEYKREQLPSDHS